MSLSNQFKIGPYTLNQLFPSECLACGQEGPWLCADCAQQALTIQTPTCPLCDRLSRNGRTCSKCRARPGLKNGLNGGRSIWYYRGSVIPFIGGFKYRKISAAESFARLSLATLLGQLPLYKTQPILLTSVPLAPKKLAQRGYNQSEVLAQGLSKATQVEYRPLLRRKQGEVSQTRLNRAERLKNVADQFSLLNPKESLSGSQIVIIDDVLTTGATLSSCAQKLRAAGATRVWALTLSRD